MPASSPDVSVAEGESGAPESAPASEPEPEPEPAPASTLTTSAAITKDPAPIVAKPTPAATKPAPVVENSAPVAEVPASAQTARSAPARQARVSSNYEPQYVWVCEFVSSDTAPSGYRLADGKQPVSVSIDALGDDVNDTGTFNDQQPSFVVGSDDAALCSSSVVTIDEEVVCPTYQYSGIVNVTTATKLYYGVTQVDFTMTQSTRQLTAEELRVCNPPPEEVYVCQFVASQEDPSGWVLKPGDQPVLMSLSELGSDVNDTGDFNASQPSFIVASADSSLCASTTSERSTQVTCATNSADGYTTDTIIRSFFYGSVKVNERTVEEVRELTDGELSECLPAELLAATAEVILVDATCTAPQQLILGAISNATWGEVTDPEGPVDYSVTATANAGAEFAGVGVPPQVGPGSTRLSFSGTLAPQLDPFSPECDLETLGLVMPAVTFSQASCTVAGSYRLGVAPGYDPALVTFTVNSVAGIVAGTYQVAGPGPVEVTAQAVGPNGLGFDWVDPPAFAFVAPGGTECDSGTTGVLPTLALGLPTLAFTGGGGVGPIWWLVPTSMILLGAAAIYVRRRMDFVS